MGRSIWFLGLLLPLLRASAGNRCAQHGAPVGLLNKLRVQLETEPLPLFHFGRDLCELLNGEPGADEGGRATTTLTLECEMLFYAYIGKLRDHYADRFSRELQDMRAPSEIAQRHKFYLDECRVAMEAGKPRHACCTAWRFDGVLAELQQDLDQAVIDRGDEADARVECAPPQSPSFGLGAVRRLWRDHKRLRWIMSQSLLLLVNFCQSEWVRN